jgi:hypothetical protein
MTRSLKIHIVLWCILSIITAIGALAFDLSSSPTYASLVLRPGESTEVHLFRIFPEMIRAELGFYRSGTKHPELGEHMNLGGQKRRDILDFPNPGEPVKLLFRLGDHQRVFEAMPAGSFGYHRIGRSLVPFVDDGNPNHFPWPPNPDLFLEFSTGNSKLIVTVLEVGNSITDEQVDVMIRPPITWKHISPNYGFLSWFFFWPVYVLILVIYGATLYFYYRRQSKNVDKVA